MSDPIFEALPETISGALFGYFEPAFALLGDDPSDTIAGVFASMVGLNDPVIVGDIRGVFEPTRGLLTNNASIISGAFESVTGFMTDGGGAPEIAVLIGAFAPMTGDIHSSHIINGDMLGYFEPLTGLLTPFASIIAGRFENSLGYMFDRLQFIGGFPIWMSPGFAYLTGPEPHPRLIDTLAMTGNPITTFINGLIERVSMGGAPLTVLEVLAHLRDSVDLVDQVAVIWQMLLQDSVKFGGVATPSLVAIERVLETLSIAAGAGHSLDVRNLLAETLALNDTLAILTQEQLSDSVKFSGTFSAALSLRANLLDQLLVTAVPTGGARFVGVIDETIDLGSTITSSFEAFERIREIVGVSLTITIGDDAFIAWVVNTETRAAWEYDNWPFNSFCEFEGKYYGMSNDGLSLLEGDDDNGDPINARIRFGMSNMGINREKRIPALYISYSATDRLIVKAITTEIDGTRTENWYQLVPRGIAGIREGRVQFGRGLKSANWDFEISNINGGDFELAGLEFLPMILDRKVRGRDE